MNYNLLDEKWIPVLWTDGKFNHVGIKEALTQAGRIQEVRDSSPLVTFGIYRLLIAVLKWLYNCTSAPVHFLMLSTVICLHKGKVSRPVLIVVE
ncbi:MAG: type I-E CRISPR-associated protein Cse1/CasA [Sedimentisphaerales bacterium]